MSKGIRFKINQDRKLEEFEIGWTPIAFIIGLISYPIVLLTKATVKLILVLSIVTQGLFSDPVPFNTNEVSK